MSETESHGYTFLVLSTWKYHYYFKHVKVNLPFAASCFNAYGLSTNFTDIYSAWLYSGAGLIYRLISIVQFL